MSLPIQFKLFTEKIKRVFFPRLDPYNTVLSCVAQSDEGTAGNIGCSNSLGENIILIYKDKVILPDLQNAV